LHLSITPLTASRSPHDKNADVARWSGAPNWYLWDGRFCAIGRSEGIVTRTFYEMFGMPPSVMMRGEFFEIPSPFELPAAPERRGKGVSHRFPR
jgi:hypothetical protein